MSAQVIAALRARAQRLEDGNKGVQAAANSTIVGRDAAVRLLIAAEFRALADAAEGLPDGS